MENIVFFQLEGKTEGSWEAEVIIVGGKPRNFGVLGILGAHQASSPPIATEEDCYAKLTTIMVSWSSIWLTDPLKKRFPRTEFI